MFKEYTPIEYMMIDVANAFGLDKKPFEQRIQWVRDHHKDLFKLAQEAENFHLYTKSVLALRTAIQTGYTNHRVALDACNSGTQMFSCLTGDVVGAQWVGLIFPDRRMDAYGELFTNMNSALDQANKLDPKLGRQKLKDAFMCHWYLSTLEPIKTFGEDTPQLYAFYQTMQLMCPGASALLETLRKVNFLDKSCTRHQWLMPDGAHIHLIARERVKARIQVEELYTKSGNATSFTHQYKVEQWHKHYKAIASRVAHSTDSYVLKELIRRAKMPRLAIERVMKKTEGARISDNTVIVSSKAITDIHYNPFELDYYNESQLAKIHRICEMLIDEPVYDIATIHDSFSTLPQHCNSVRRNYNEVLAEIAESNMLSTILSNLYQTEIQWQKFPQHEDLPQYIRACNYSLS